MRRIHAHTFALIHLILGELTSRSNVRTIQTPFFTRKEGLHTMVPNSF